MSPHDEDAAAAVRVRGVVETCLYVDDMRKARGFWVDLLGFGVLFEDDRLCALNTGKGAVLLLFRRGASTEAVTLSGGVIPPHDGAGSIHIGLAIDAADFDRWREHLERARVAIESIVSWPRGGRSIYFRDPDGNLVELLTPGVWTVY
jgi:catechol 2,3-dioxygenase-like lactoylglutathione lyase family enzyme